MMSCKKKENLLHLLMEKNVIQRDAEQRAEQTRLLHLLMDQYDGIINAALMSLLRVFVRR